MTLQVGHVYVITLPDGSDRSIGVVSDEDQGWYTVTDVLWIDGGWYYNGDHRWNALIPAKNKPVGTFALNLNQIVTVMKWT